MTRKLKGIAVLIAAAAYAAVVGTAIVWAVRWVAGGESQ